MRIFRNAWFSRFARKEHISDSDLREAVARAGRGLVDADLGGGLIKQRVARPGTGRSGGYRTILIFRIETRSVFVFGFAKNNRSNLSADEEVALKKAAKLVLAFSEDEINAEVASGRLTEIPTDAEDT